MQHLPVTVYLGAKPSSVSIGKTEVRVTGLHRSTLLRDRQLRVWGLLQTANRVQYVLRFPPRYRQ